MCRSRCPNLTRQKRSRALTSSSPSPRALRRACARAPHTSCFQGSRTVNCDSTRTKLRNTAVNEEFEHCEDSVPIAASTNQVTGNCTTLTLPMDFFRPRPQCCAVLMPSHCSIRSIVDGIEPVAPLTPCPQSRQSP